MVMMEVDNAGHKFVFSLPQGAPYQGAFDALSEIQAQLLEWQKMQEQRAAETKPAAVTTEQTSA